MPFWYRSNPNNLCCQFHLPCDNDNAVLCLQCLLLLDKIPAVLPEDGAQTALHDTLADITGYSQPDGGKTCLQLLYKILSRAVLALTQNK